MSLTATTATTAPSRRARSRRAWRNTAVGWSFILPNFLIVATLGALYVRFEGLPAVAAIFYGVSPAVIALILHSCYRLTKLGMKVWNPSVEILPDTTDPSKFEFRYAHISYRSSEILDRPG